MIKIIICCNNRILADKVGIADTFLTRFKGLMGRKSLGAGEGLLLVDCRSIHCFFMKMSIDAVYLAKDMTVLGVELLTPWRIGGRFQKAAHVLELGAGTALVSAGDVLKLYESER